MKTRTGAAIRRALVLSAFVLGIVGSIQSQNILVFVSAGLSSFALAVDYCPTCKLPFIVMRGHNIVHLLNPFYVPKVCPRCRSNFDR